MTTFYSSNYFSVFLSLFSQMSFCLFSIFSLSLSYFLSFLLSVFFFSDSEPQAESVPKCRVGEERKNKIKVKTFQILFGALTTHVLSLYDSFSCFSQRRVESFIGSSLWIREEMWFREAKIFLWKWSQKINLKTKNKFRQNGFSVSRKHLKIKFQFKSG